MLGNTATICPKCYSHPAMLDGEGEGGVEFVAEAGKEKEIALVRFLKAAAKA